MALWACMKLFFHSLSPKSFWPLRFKTTSWEHLGPQANKIFLSVTDLIMIFMPKSWFCSGMSCGWGSQWQPVLTAAPDNFFGVKEKEMVPDFVSSNNLSKGMVCKGEVMLKMLMLELKRRKKSENSWTFTACSCRKKKKQQHSTKISHKLGGFLGLSFFLFFF